MSKTKRALHFQGIYMKMQRVKLKGFQTNKYSSKVQLPAPAPTST